VAIVSVGVYFWNAKETIADETRGVRRYQVRVYRFRPITEFRFDQDANPYRTHRTTFGAVKVERIDNVRWLGGDEAVVLSLRAPMGSGGIESRRVYYDFGTGALLTTFDGRNAERLDGALHQWMANKDAR
jgi:hypothetical protein